MNVHERQSLLEATIGPFEEETYAYQVIFGLAIGYPIVLVIFTFIQYHLYLLYNQSQHPFKVLTQNKDTIIKEQKKNKARKVEKLEEKLDLVLKELDQAKKDIKDLQEQNDISHRMQ